MGLASLGAEGSFRAERAGQILTQKIKECQWVEYNEYVRIVRRGL